MGSLVNEIILEDLEKIFQDSLPDLENLVNRRVIITGASGFIGSWLALSFLYAHKVLKGEGHIVFSCRNSAPLRKLLEQGNFTQGFSFVESDIRKFPAGIIRNGDLVVHAATPARESFNLSSPVEMFDVIVNGQRHLLELCANEKNVRFLFLSSGAVYGRQPLELKGLAEDWPGAPDVTKPVNAYHEGKRAAELLGFAMTQNSSFEFISARLFAFLAPFLPLDEHFAAGNFLRDALAGNEILIKSGGGSVRSYQYGTDLCSDLWSLLTRGKPGEAYNVGSEEEVSILELAKLIGSRSPKHSGIRVGGLDTFSTLTRYVPVTRKIEALNKTVQRVPLDKAVDRTIDWLTRSHI